MKERITITLDKELLEWVDQQIARKLFANRSHAFEYLIKRKQEEEHG
ncbi:MAG TPA: ribbon-helix-helix domain-containing protein [Candidatus Nanoarchaeia archaeon]|nr:ribbon-helix-helix domain-containing protein [Candidatus Nanoarchaeia archaeon]